MLTIPNGARVCFGPKASMEVGPVHKYVPSAVFSPEASVYVYPLREFHDERKKSFAQEDVCSLFPNPPQLPRPAHDFVHLGAGASVKVNMHQITALHVASSRGLQQDR